MSLYLQLSESKFTFNIQVDDGKGSNTGKLASDEIDGDGEVSDHQDDDASDISQVPSTSSSNSKQGKVCNIVSKLYDNFIQCCPFSQ